MPYQFFPADVAASLPPLHSQEKLGEEAIAHVKFFTPDANWTWYATEYDTQDQVFFGLMFGLETEFGYFALDELRETKGPLGLHVERDIHWQPRTIGQVRTLHGRR